MQDRVRETISCGAQSVLIISIAMAELLCQLLLWQYCYGSIVLLCQYCDDSIVMLCQYCYGSIVMPVLRSLETNSLNGGP